MTKNRLPFLFLMAFLALFCGSLAFGWMRQTPSFEELYGGGGKLWDYFTAARSVGGWPWWTPNFLLGHSHALMNVSLLPLLVVQTLIWLVGPWAPAFVASKIFGILVIFCAGLSLYALAKRLEMGAWTAAFTAVLYVTSAQFVLRIAILEHLSTAACMIFAPLILLALLRCERNPSWRSATLLALCVAAMLVCYAKIFILFLPAAACFFGWRLVASGASGRRNLLLGSLRGLGITLLLAFLPLIPVFRETRFLALFDLEPFAGWQQNFSFFSALSWVDWGNVLTQGTVVPILTATKHPVVEFYLGLVVLGGIFLGLVVGRSRAELTVTPAWNILRMFSTLLLLATWLASGPRSVIGSHFAYLAGSAGCPDVTIPLVWVGLLAQGALIYLIIGPGIFRVCAALVAMGIYYFVPGFRLLEMIPSFGDIRAPSAVWTAFGTLGAIVAAGAGWSLLSAIPAANWKRVAAGCVLLALLSLDLSFLHRAFFRPGLPETMFREYSEAQQFLTKAPLAGRVQAISGRYFYLTTPRDSGRSLSSEALLRHFQLKSMRYMEAGSQASPETLRAYFDLFGISYVLIDRFDPDGSEEYNKSLLSTFPTVFENAGFTILENASSLYPAYAAKDLIVAETDIFKNPATVLQLGRGGLIAVEDLKGPSVGRVKAQGAPEVPNRAELERVVDLRKVRLSDSRMQNFQSFSVSGLASGDAPGLLVVTEAFHPDWTAEQNGKTLPVLRSVGALLSVQLDAADDVTFRFSPPWYYSACMTISLGAWILCLSLFGFMRLPLPASWRAAWFGADAANSSDHGRNVD